MAEEPNKRMDEALRAYADKRRQDTGAAVELHPATRQMLQAEVARTYKTAHQEVSWLHRLFTAWPRIAFAGACIVITLTLVLVLLPPRTVQQMAQTSAPEEETLSRDARVADKEKADSYLFADSPAPMPSTAPVQPSMRGLNAKQKETDELQAKSEVAEARKDMDAVQLVREELASQSYVNIANAAGPATPAETAQLGAKLVTLQPVLNNFRVEQTGDSIRLYDQDGSVYAGNLLSNEEAKKRYIKLQTEGGRGVQTAGGSVAGEQLFFAVGTNISLRQPVSVEGNIVLQMQTNATPGLARSSEIQQQNRRSGAQSQVIRGRARVGTNQEIAIEAVPAKP